MPYVVLSALKSSNFVFIALLCIIKCIFVINCKFVCSHCTTLKIAHIVTNIFCLFPSYRDYSLMYALDSVSMGLSTCKRLVTGDMKSNCMKSLEMKGP